VESRDRGERTDRLRGEKKTYSKHAESVRILYLLACVRVYMYTKVRYVSRLIIRHTYILFARSRNNNRPAGDRIVRKQSKQCARRIPSTHTYSFVIMFEILRDCVITTRKTSRNAYDPAEESADYLILSLTTIAISVCSKGINKKSSRGRNRYAETGATSIGTTILFKYICFGFVTEISVLNVIAYRRIIN